MRRIVKIFIIFFIIILFVLTSAYFYLRVKGKDLVVQSIEQQLGKKISFGSVNFSYPLTVKIEQISVEGYGNAKEAIFSLSLPYLLLGEVHFGHIEVVEPYILLTRQGDTKTSWIPLLAPSPPAQANEGAAPASDKKKSSSFALFAKEIVVRGGTLEVFESAGSQASRVFQLKKISAHIDRFSFPVQKPMKTSFELKALVSGFEGRFFNEEFRIAGWADFYQKDMLAKATLTGVNGQVGLKADLVSVKNDMTVKGSMSLSFNAKTSSAEGTKNVEGLVVQALQSSGANIDLRFQFKTAMDDFKIGKISLSGELNKSPMP